jgi:hypothetical protein
MSRGALLLAALLPFACVTLGCSSGPSFGEAEGSVTLDGKPLGKVRVLFTPDPDSGSHGPSSHAVSDAQGHYRLTGLDPRQTGVVVVGKHRVTVTEPDPPKGPPAAGPSKRARAVRFKREVPSVVPGRYQSLLDTPLRVDVRRGKQTIDLKLTTAP